MCVCLSLSIAMNKHNMTLCVCACVCRLLLVFRGLSTKRICPIITFINASMGNVYNVPGTCCVVGTLYGTRCVCALCTNNIDKNWAITRIMYQGVLPYMMIDYFTFGFATVCHHTGYLHASRLLQCLFTQ